MAVAEELHFGHAAERLNMTQPPLSRQIQKLEKSMDIQLLDRTNRSVQLTLGGEAFLAQARRLLALADEATATARRAADGTKGHLRLGFTAASSLSALGAFLDTANSLVPDLDVDMHELVTRDQVQKLQEEHLDIGLGRPSGIPEDIETTCVFEEKMMLVAPKNHELTRQKLPIDPVELAGIPFIIQSPTNARYFFDLIMRLAPIDEHQIVHRTSQVLTILSLVRAGRGLACVPESTQQIHMSGVSFLPLEDNPRARAQLHALWSPSNTNPVLGRLLKHLRKEKPIH